MKHVFSNDVTCPQGTTFLQYVGENTNYIVFTIDGENTHHGLGSTSIANGNFGETSA